MTTYISVPEAQRRLVPLRNYLTHSYADLPTPALPQVPVLHGTERSASTENVEGTLNHNLFRS